MGVPFPGFPGGTPSCRFMEEEYMSFQVMLQQLTTGFGQTLLIFFLAALSDSSRTTIILAGITVSSFLSAGINTIKLLNTDITVNLTSFLIGSLSGLT